MIKIVQGKYGHKVNGIIKAIDSSHPPIRLSKKEEERLVELGVAVYVDDTTEEEINQEEINQKESSENSSVPTPYDKSMTLKQLNAIATENGIDTDDIKTKDEVIALLDEFYNDEPPSFKDDGIIDE